MEPGFDLKRYPILVVDDEQDNLDAFRFNFRKQFELLTAKSGAEALELLQGADPAVIVTDQRMPGMTGIELLKQAAAVRPDAVGIILTAYTDVDVLIEAVNMGQVYRYITKPWDSREVKAVLVQAVERHHLGRENKRLQAQLQDYVGYLEYQAHSAFDFGAIVGESEALRQVLARVEQVATTVTTVLLRGETGTGKEMVARAMHLNSDRGERPFVAVNCAALPAELLESELFGHEKGAFTGAVAQRKGRFELADGGTIFLDEVGDLPMEVQVKLLRVLQEREFERVGGTGPLKVDVRVVSATNRDLEVAGGAGDLPPGPLLPAQRLPHRAAAPARAWPRRDPAGRALLGQVRAAEPPRPDAHRGRRRRGADGPRLAGQRARGAERDRARGHRLRGRGARRPRTSTSAGAPPLARRSHRARSARGRPRPLAGAAQPLRTRLAEEEKASIVRAIEGSAGNIAAAARALGINRSTLYFRIKKYELDYLLPNKLGGAPEA